MLGLERGVVPEDRGISGQRLRLSWLIEHFPSLTPDTDVESVRCYARAFILQLIGGFLFADKSNNMFGLLQHILKQCDMELGLHKYDLRGRHDLDWMSSHHHYIQRWEARYNHLARTEATSTSYGLQQIHLWTGPDTSNIGHRDEIHQLSATNLEAIHEADRLLILLNVDDIERQPLDEEVVMRDGVVRTRGGGVRTRGGGVWTRGGGVRTRGGGV
ncbi:hypothetical protein CK203_100769 [Vitis vinifera]|uniref:Serine/threonine-protein phosphatase 7 long form-like n=1 Tax=Vitis vinifera TaxID=29760 RepID=A0A438DES4_VITVI|nr:hypothetical protein CK203_100769 [Vitis vinifera]